jgi:hypothetical protein
LTIAQRVACRATIAKANVEIPVGAEGELAAVVVTKRLRYLQDDGLASRIGYVGVALVHREPGYY